MAISHLSHRQPALAVQARSIVGMSMQVLVVVVLLSHLLNNLAVAVGTRPFAPNPDGSKPEQRYLQAKGWCYHRVSQNPNVHRARKCPQKIRNEAAGNMPADFKPGDQPEKA